MLGLGNTDFGLFTSGSGGTPSGVTSVGGTPPIASSGGTTPNISISQSSGSTDGFLSSTDWTTFNSKVSSVGNSSPIVSSGGANPTISITQASGSTNGFLSSTNWTTFNNKPINNQIVAGYQGLGSLVKAVPIGLNLSLSTTSTSFVSGTIKLMPIYLSVSATITGVKWYQNNTPNFTGNNYNGVGLYSVSGGILTLIGSSTNNANLWKTFASQTWGNVEFSTSITNLAVGTYYIGALFNGSPVTLAPAIIGYTSSAAVIQAFDFTGGKLVANSATLQTILPNNITLTATSGTNISSWLSLY